MIPYGLTQNMVFTLKRVTTNKMAKHIPVIHNKKEEKLFSAIPLHNPLFFWR